MFICLNTHRSGAEAISVQMVKPALVVRNRQPGAAAGHHTQKAPSCGEAVALSYSEEGPRVIGTAPACRCRH